MNAYVLLNLLSKFEKREKNILLVEHFIFFTMR